ASSARHLAGAAGLLGRHSSVLLSISFRKSSASVHTGGSRWLVPCGQRPHLQCPRRHRLAMVKARGAVHGVVMYLFKRVDQAATAACSRSSAFPRASIGDSHVAIVAKVLSTLGHVAPVVSVVVRRSTKPTTKLKCIALTIRSVIHFWRADRDQ